MQSGATRKTAVGEGRSTTSKVDVVAAVAPKRGSVRSPVVYDVFMQELILVDRTGPGWLLPEQKLNQITNQPRERASGNW
jgi:hypothetical protein